MYTYIASRTNFVLYYDACLGQPSFNLHFSSAANLSANLSICCYEESCSLVKESILLAGPTWWISRRCLLQLPPQHTAGCCAQWHSTIHSTVNSSHSFLHHLALHLQHGDFKWATELVFFFFLEEFCRSAEYNPSHSFPSLWWVKVLVISLLKAC